jgi:hypothetical protein
MNYKHLQEEVKKHVLDYFHPIKMKGWFIIT